MISSITLVKKTISIFLERVKLFLTIIAIPALLSFGVSFIEPGVEDSATLSADMLFFLVLIIVSLVVSAFMTIALVHAVADSSLTVKDLFKKAQAQFFKYLGFIILLSLVVTLGFIVLIIPGIWLSVVYAFGMYYLLLENKSIAESFGASKQLVKGRWWAVALRLLMLVAVSMAFFIVIEILAGMIDEASGGVFGYALSSALAVLVTPIGIIYAYELFKDLKNTSAETKVEPMASETSAV